VVVGVCVSVCLSVCECVRSATTARVSPAATARRNAASVSEAQVKKAMYSAS